MDRGQSDPRDFLPLTHVTYHVLLAVVDEPMHGYGIIKEIGRRTDGRMDLEAGTLYAAIKRLIEEGLLEPAAGRPGEDARRRYYQVTAFGKEVVRAESERLLRLIDLAREKRVLPAAGGA